MDWLDAIQLLRKYVPPDELSQVMASFEAYSLRMNNRYIPRDYTPFAEARVYIDNATGGMNYVGYATSEVELLEIVSKISDLVYFHILIWLDEVIVGNGVYFNVGNGILKYVEHGACRGFFKRFDGIFTNFIDENAAESYRPTFKIGMDDEEDAGEQ